MGQFGDIVLGEEALEIAEALDVFDDERGIFGRAGKDLLEPAFSKPMTSSRNFCPQSGQQAAPMAGNGACAPVPTPVWCRQGDGERGRCPIGVA